MTICKSSATMEIVRRERIGLSAMKFSWKLVIPLLCGSEWTLPKLRSMNLPFRPSLCILCSMESNTIEEEYSMCQG